MASNAVFGRKAVILAVLVAVGIMFVASFLYRMENPNLFVKARMPGQQRQQQIPGVEPGHEEHDHDGDGVPDGEQAMQKQAMPGNMGGAMSKVREFMARVEKDPNDVEALMGLGNAFLMMRAWDRALEPLGKAAALDSTNTSVLKGIGIAYFNKEDFEKAAQSYEAILKINGKDTLALFNLGVITKHYFKDVDAARGYFEKVLELEKDDAEMTKLATEELKK